MDSKYWLIFFGTFEFDGFFFKDNISSIEK